MTLLEVSKDSSATDLHIRELLAWNHTTLDQNYIIIWTKLWPCLQSHQNSASSADAVKVLHKLVDNYSNVHQLPRFIARFLEAFRSFPAEVPTFPTVLYENLRRVFSDASEQQMSNILGILAKECVSLVENLQKSVEVPVHRLRILSQLLWIVLKNLRIKSTTRQEILGDLCRKIVELRKTVIEPLTDICKMSADHDLLYICLLLTHAWIDVPIIFKDRIELPSKHSTKMIRRCLRAFQVIQFASVILQRPCLVSCAPIRYVEI